MNDPNFNLVNVTPPVGSIIAFAGNVASFTDPPQIAGTYTTQPIEAYGWMICDGSELMAHEYPELYSVLGNLYGGSGSGNDAQFRLPDLRGQFLRGVSTSDASLENRQKASGEQGSDKGVGSRQGDALQTHVHSYSKPIGAGAGNSGPAFAAVDSDALTGIPIEDKTITPPEPTVNVSELETRPTNTFVYYLIKYTNGVAIFNHIPHL